MPDIAGTPLNGPEKVHTTDLCLGKVSVVTFLSSKISEVCQFRSNSSKLCVG